ncbi:MAG: DUF4870 domain-containing protein [Planctomycetota bacterium]|nr:DUF4870 domain-containing protein [Planctomycetota bacterium]MEE2972477.1 DUF4870 domain-containing protein [Planctomycetota bacterium]
MASNHSPAAGDPGGGRWSSKPPADPATRYDIAPRGNLRSLDERDGDRLILVLAQLWPFVGILSGTLPLLWIAVLGFWAVRKDSSSLVDDQGREICNTLITLLILVVVPVIGWMVALVWIPVWLVNTVRAAVANGRSEYFRYPMVLRVVR